MSLETEGGIEHGASSNEASRVGAPASKAQGGITSGGWLAKIIYRVGVGLVSLSQNREAVGVLWRWARSVVLWLTVCYGLCFWALWLFLAWVGERNITSAFFLYLPPSIWFIPLLPVFLLSVFINRFCSIIQMLLVAGMMWGWLGYGFRDAGAGRDRRDKDIELTIMTYNRGQHMNQSLQPFKNAMRPDLLVLQEAPGRADGFLNSADYAEFGHAASLGEFTLLSRYPIKGYSLIPNSESARNARAVRFVIDWMGREVSIYAVHLRTPRDVLQSYMRGAFLWGLLGVPGTTGATKRRQYQTFWDGQMNDAEKILATVKSDVNPCIVAGDFNAPHTGYIHQIVTRELGDAHASAGHGFGFTFPGVTRNPLSLGGPWMRIDYIFYDRRWKAVECVTEKDRPSQHRAVVARMRLLDGNFSP